MKKISLIIIILVLISLPFMFTQKGADMLEEEGYSVKVSEKTEVYMPAECETEDCALKSGEIIQVS